MDRRGFLRNIGLGIGGIALEQAIPLGRVWSFPKKIVLPELTSADCVALQLEKVRAQIPVIYERDLFGLLYFETDSVGDWYGLKRYSA